MKANSSNKNVQVSDDLESRSFTIEVSAAAFKAAYNKYTHPQRAVIREYACNALDSHVMAGTEDTKFIIHLPTEWEPWFSIRDFGTGIPHDEVFDVFTRLHASTKRDSNSQIGTFGIGSKVAFAVADTFIVHSFYNGEKRIYSCYLDEHEIPHTAHLSTEATDEPNGVYIEIQNPRGADRFRDEAINTFMYFDTLPEINDESVFEAITERRKDYLEGENFALSYRSGDCKAVMGNVAYDIPYQYDDLDCDGYIIFEIGELDIKDDRETLILTDKTIAALKAKFEQVKQDFAPFVKELIEEKPTHFTRCLEYQRLNRGWMSKIMRLKANAPLFEDYILPKPTAPITYFSKTWRGGVKKDSTATFLFNDAIEIYREKERMTSRIRQHVREEDVTVVIVNDVQITELGIDDDVLLDLEDLPKVVRQSTGGGSTVRSTERVFKMTTGYASSYGSCKSDWIATDLDLTQDDEIVYVELYRWQLKDSRFPYVGRAQDALKKAEQLGVTLPTVYGIKGSLLKTKKFGKCNTITLDAWLKREVAKVAPKELVAYSGDYDSDFKEFAEKCDISDIEDISEFVELLGTVNNDKQVFLESLGIEVEIDDSFADMGDALVEKYPMLKYFFSRWSRDQNWQEAIDYVTMVNDCG